ncbi:hypothetical protein [Clostridium scatologenes]|uniref:Uncharacterized protein n=1 Tax=Clostridium scatologenes TaxID=1548 RepID=A0A0E3K1P5_CLOSL|nr:hypothetical protein [Clostridium scatologenes]AKA70164.1 hypothetical protein CSCA_3039 [Clostridium scatologenes]
MKKGRTNVQIYTYCNERWAFYKKIDGGYYPSKHDSVVLEEVAKKFNITPEKAEKIYRKIVATKTVKQCKGLTNKEKDKLLEDIVRDNKETPWGQGIA